MLFCKEDEVGAAPTIGSIFMKTKKAPVCVDVLLADVGFLLNWVDPKTHNVKSYNAKGGASEMASQVASLLVNGKTLRKSVIFKTDANGKKVVVKNGQVVGRQG